MADGDLPLLEARAPVLRARLEAGSIIAALSVLAFAVVDLLWGHPSLRLTSLRGVQILCAGAAWLFSRRAKAWDDIANGCLVFIAVLTATAVMTAVERGETDSVPVLVTMIVLITATFAGWGLRRQVVLSLLAFGGLAANMAALGKLGAAVPYPFLPITVALGVSAWVAAETDRQARARHHAEVALRESEHRFRTLAAHAPVPIWMTDTKGHLTYLNEAWDSLVPGAPTPDRAVWTAVHPDDRSTLAAAAAAARSAGTPYEGECRIVAPDGSTRHLAISGIPRFTAGGTYDGHIGTAVDVTETKAEARSLAAAHRAAVEAGNLKSTFLATMSHEIRTPMHGIFGMTELALDTTDESERREFIERARSCAKTLMTLLDEILDLSRIEAGKLDLVREPVDLAEIIRNAVDTVAMAAAQKGIDIFMEIAPDVPITIGSDPNRLRQILTNLLANAVKFTEVGAVAVRAGIHDGALMFRVEDTGVGIPPERIDHIFEAFTQAHRDTGHRYGGTGLGLAISHRLARALGGDIRVHSTLGVGTTFEVSHPLHAPVGPPQAAQFGALRGTPMLVADPNDRRRQELTGALRAYGCIVEEASDTDTVARALDRTPDKRPAVVIVDAEMLQRDGDDARPLRPSHPPLTIVTCALKPGARDGVATAGHVVVTRPLLPISLLDKVIHARTDLARTGS